MNWLGFFTAVLLLAVLITIGALVMDYFVDHDRYTVYDVFTEEDQDVIG